MDKNVLDSRGSAEERGVVALVPRALSQHTGVIFTTLIFLVAACQHQQRIMGVLFMQVVNKSLTR